MKILIVDDEKMIRNWLTILLHQITDKKIEIATAGNVNDALEYCAQNEVHLVFTDITMPQRNGLELLQILRESYPKINTVVLSAYDDYQYIRTAMHLGAIDYILKSEMQLSDIISVLRKVEIFSGITDPTTRDDKELPKIADYNLNDYLHDKEAFCKFLKDTAPKLSTDEITVCILMLGEICADQKSGILDICNKTLLSEGVVGCTYYAKNIFWVIYNTGQTVYESCNEIRKKIALLIGRNLQDFSKQSIVKMITETASDIDSLRMIISKQLNLIILRRYYSLSGDEGAVVNPISQTALMTMMKNVVFFLDIHRYSAATNALTEFVRESHKSHVYPAYIKAAIHHCITIFFLDYGEHKDNILFASTYQNINQRLSYADTAEAVEEILNNFIELYKNTLNNTKKLVMHPSIKKALAYIDQNYMNKLTLDDLAKNVYLNKSYVSQMFITYLGITFVEYLESLRIHKAQELLRNTEASITKIAENIGYSTQSYFTKVFKKRMGMSPIKYRAISKSNDTSLIL